MRRTWRRALGGLVGMGIVTAASAPARATDSPGRVLVTVLVTALIADVSFAVHGISVAGKGKLPSASWSIAETVVTVPQTIAANVLYVGRHRTTVTVTTMGSAPPGSCRRSAYRS